MTHITKIVIFLVLNGPGIDAKHCILESIEGHVTVHPLSTLCFVNGEVINKSKRLKQGMESFCLSQSRFSIHFGKVSYIVYNIEITLKIFRYQSFLFHTFFTIHIIGDVLLLGKANTFRYNHPGEAAKLRKKRMVSLFLLDMLFYRLVLLRVAGIAHGQLLTLVAG